MPILTNEEAAKLLDYETVDEMPEKVTAVFLPAVDDFLKNATGKDWGALTETYTVVDPVAKMVAGVLLVRWFENPAMIGKTNDDGVIAMIGQLAAKATQEKQAI